MSGFIMMPNRWGSWIPILARLTDLGSKRFTELLRSEQRGGAYSPHYCVTSWMYFTIPQKALTVYVWQMGRPIKRWGRICSFSYVRLFRLMTANDGIGSLHSIRSISVCMFTLNFCTYLLDSLPTDNNPLVDPRLHSCSEIKTSSSHVSLLSSVSSPSSLCPIALKSRLTLSSAPTMSKRLTKKVTRRTRYR